MLKTTDLLRRAAILSLGLALSHAPARADTFNVTLTPTTGTEGGTGTFTFNGPITGTLFTFGTQYSGPNLLTALSFTFVEGTKSYTFDLTNKTGNAYGQFLNGSLYDLTYAGTLVNHRSPARPFSRGERIAIPIRGHLQRGL